MTLRFVPNTFTLDEQRQEINNLASDVNSIDTAFDERVDDRLSALLSGGTGISATYNDNSNSLSLSIDFTEFNTDSLTEGTNKLFFTQSRARESFSIAAEPTASGNGDLSYNSSTGVFTYTPPALTLSDITTNGNTTTNTITVGGANLGDNSSLYFGNGNDLEIKSDGANGYIRQHTSSLSLYSNELYLRNYTNNEPYLKAVENGSVELYYDNSKKFETTITGITVTGSVLIDNSLYVNSAYPGIGAQILETGAYRSRVDDVSGTVQDALVLGRFQNLDSFVVKANGNLTTVGDITANKLVKSGGTSAQFLKADGSVDTTTYLSSYTETDTLQSVTDRGASSSNPLTFSYAGQALTLTGASSRLDVQNGGTYAISLNSSTGINTNQGVGLYIGNYGTSLWRAEINGTNGNINTEGSVTAASLSGSLVISGSTAPTIASSTGTAGEIRYDADYIYICIATDTWKRALIETWA